MSILHVHVSDDLTGDLLADVDAQSTADGLAYYLRSRRIDTAADPAEIAAEAGAGVRDAIVLDNRDLIGRTLIRALAVHVAGDARDWCPGCQRASVRVPA